jgi:16S rRNA (cytosine1402-N4)-methyltransferase
MADSYHIPVLLEESVQGLNIRHDGVYVDVTFGGGGHSKLILENLETGKLYAFDQDKEAKANATAVADRSFTFIEANFRHLEKFLRFHKVSKVHGILADLGVSSHQINEGSRGFSTRFDGELDMRMNQQKGKSARDVINSYEEKDLIHLFSFYGEVKNARTLAAAVVDERNRGEIRTTAQFLDLLKPYAKRGQESKYAAQVFQAIRIEVNDEMEALKEFLSSSVSMLDQGGRLVVISYHSLEDRLVKHFFNYGNFEGTPEKDFYGNLVRPLKPITRKPMVASINEIERNKRARSAKLRIAEKI